MTTSMKKRPRFAATKGGGIRALSRGARTLLGAVVTCVIVAGSLVVPPVASHATPVDAVILDDASVRQQSPDANYGTSAALIVRNDIDSFIRLDLSQISADDLAAVELQLSKKYSANQIVVTQAGEFLTHDGVETAQRWDESNLTWATKPLDLPGTASVTTDVGAGEIAFSITITSLVAEAKARGAETLTLRLSTAGTVGTDIHSTRASDAAERPWVAVSHTTDEVPQDYPVVHRFDDYPSNAHTAQDVVRIATDGGRYLEVDDASGAVGLTDDVEQATMFAIYAYDYTASDYDGTGGGQRTTYAIQSLSNGKFLTIQNYSTAEDSEYYARSGTDYLVTATAPEVNWNERFQIQVYPESNRYTISSHLTSTRDGAEASTDPVKADETAMTVTPGDQRTHLYIFESVDANLLEVHQTVTGTSARFDWLPIHGDTDPAHYSLDGATVTYQDGTMRAVVDDLAAGEHTFTVRYHGGADAVETEVRVRIFNHPGVSLTEEQLTAMRERVTQKAEPWYSDYLALKNTVPNDLSSLDFTVEARASVGRGNPAGSGGMNVYDEASAAAYFHALQWVITQDHRHADMVVDILNAWSSTLTQIDGRDQILGAGLGTLKLINAAEIVRYYDGGYDGYADEDFAAFQQLMLNVVYPVIQDAGVPMTANGNWDLAAIVTVEAIGVVTDNTTIFDEAIAMYKSPHINGSIVNYVSDWGQAMESARDQAHAQLGLGLMGDICTIADNQGVDLWGLEDNKLARAYNWVAEYNLFHGEGTLRAEPIENVFGRTDVWAYWDQMDQQIIVRGQLRPIYESALAHYSDVEGVDVSWMSRVAEAMRPQGFVHFDHLNFETLTMYDGEPTEQVTPYFQLRTMLKPWYQRTWAEVSAWGDVPASQRTLVDGGVLPADYTTETLESYFAVQDDHTVAIDAMQEDAPFFRLVRNDDESYSVQDVASGRYLGVTPTVVDGENLITADSLVVGDAQKFELRSTGTGRYNLVHDGRLVTVSVDGSLEAPRDATVSLRLGTALEADGGTGAPEVGFFFSFGEGDIVDRSEVTVHDSTLTTGDTWDPLDNLEAATDHRGDPIEDLSLVGVTGEVDVTTPGVYTITYHSGTATATATVTVMDPGPATSRPGRPQLSNDNWDGDGTFTLTMDMWWGQNGWDVQWYEDGVLLETQKLTDATPAAQQATLQVSGRTNGQYVYTAVLSNQHGSTTSLPMTVDVTTANPGMPELWSDNWDRDGDFTISMNMWWGTNATTYRLYENGVLVDEQELSVDGRNAQSAKTTLTDRAAGTYTYEAVLANPQGETRSQTLTVVVDR